MKFQTGLVTQYRAEREKEKEQKKLRERHDIRDDNVVVVEKSNTVKFAIRTFIRLIKLFATAALLLLAVVGIIGLLYPAPRTELLSIVNETWEQIKSFLT